MNLDHIAIAVNNIKESSKLYGFLQPSNIAFKTFISEDVKIAMLNFGNIKIELLEPLSDNSTIKKFLNNNGQGLHHISFSVSNLKKYIELAKEKNFKIIDNISDVDHEDNKMIFLHPKSFNGVLIELIERNK